MGSAAGDRIIPGGSGTGKGDGLWIGGLTSVVRLPEAGVRDVSPRGMLGVGVVVVSWGGIMVGMTFAEGVSVGTGAVHTGSEASNSGGGNAPNWPATPESVRTENTKPTNNTSLYDTECTRTRVTMTI